MTVPPYVAACICCIAAGWLADKHGQRGIYMIFFNCVAIFGFVLLICSSNNHLKYAGTFFAAMGIYPNVPQGVAWNGNNIGGSTKRGVGIGESTPSRLCSVVSFLFPDQVMRHSLTISFYHHSHACGLRQSRWRHRRVPVPL